MPPSELIFPDQKSVASARSLEVILHEESSLSNSFEYGSSSASDSGGLPL